MKNSRDERKIEAIPFRKQFMFYEDDDSMNPISKEIDKTEKHEEAPRFPENPDAKDHVAKQEFSASSTSPFDRWLIRTLLRRVGKPPFQITLWDNQPVVASPEFPHLNVRVHDRAMLLKLCLSPDVQFGEGFSQGRIEIEGDLVQFLEAAYKYHPQAGRISRMFQRWRLRNAHSLESSKNNIHHHYDLGNDFYRLWLDEQLLYTCAYFPDPGLTLEQAQIAKMEHVCRKLRLQPGQRVVEAGCGWGALSLHMAREYGVHVTACNISTEQVRYARERARREGLDDHVEFLEDDWRNLSGSYDAFVSVGMLEHVGVENYPQLGHVVHQVLRPEGLALFHSIGKNVAEPLDPWVEQRIFPGAEPPSLKQMMEIFEGHRFSVLDVENLRLHYAQTLRHWLQRYQEREEAVRDLYDEAFVRAWRLYLAGSIAAFTTSSLQLFQVVFAHPDNNHVPRSRAFLYDSPPQTGPGSKKKSLPDEELF